MLLVHAFLYQDRDVLVRQECDSESKPRYLLDKMQLSTIFIGFY